MGTYATTTSLDDLMVGTTFDSATTSLCSRLITHAENEVNKYLSKRYDVSTFVAGSVPPLVTSLTETLTEGYMYQRMSRGGKETLAHGKGLIDQALENLKLIAEFKLGLTDTAGSDVPAGGSSVFSLQSSTLNYSPTFNEDDELNWKIDDDKLDDIEAGRD